MSYDYQYIDSAHSYIDPISGILRNIPNLSKDSELIFFESTVVSKRLLELELNPSKSQIQNPYSKFINAFFKMYMNGQEKFAL
jgi:hypothetical protein